MAIISQPPPGVSRVEATLNVLTNATNYGFDPNSSIRIWWDTTHNTTTAHVAYNCVANGGLSPPHHTTISAAAQLPADTWCPTCVSFSDSSVGAHAAVGTLAAWLGTHTVAGVAKAFSAQTMLHVDHQHLDATLDAHARNIIDTLAAAHPDCRLARYAAMLDGEARGEMTTMTIGVMQHRDGIKTALAQTVHRQPGSADPTTATCRALLMSGITDCYQLGRKNTTQAGTLCMTVAADIAHEIGRMHAFRHWAPTVVANRALTDSEQQIADTLHREGRPIVEAVDIARLIATH